MKISIILTLILSITFSVAANNQLTVYPVPDEAVLNQDFTVKVRQPGQAWQTISPYLVKVMAVKGLKRTE